MLKIDVVNNTYSLVGKMRTIPTFFVNDYGEAILGNDGYIYWPPLTARRTLKFDTETQTISRVGDDFGELERKWQNGAVASDGAVYCLVPANAGQVLRIEFQEFESIHFRRSLQRS